MIGKIGVFVGLSLLLIGSAAAEYLAPNLVRVSTQKPAPGQLVFHPGTYKYKIAWQGIPVASSEIVLGEKPTLFIEDVSLDSNRATIRATAKSAKVMDLLYKLRHTSESVFDTNSLRPIRFFAEQTENSRYKKWDVHFRESSEIDSRLWKKPTDIEPSEVYNFPSDNFTVDPLFGAILARSIPVEIGSEASFDVWNGKNRYLISFKVEAEESFRFGKTIVPAYRVVPKVQKLTDTEGEKRLRSCTLWVSADDRREILRVESAVLIGKVSATLESFTPAPGPTPPLVEAKSEQITPSQARAMLKDSQSE